MKYRYASDLHLEFAFDRVYGFLDYQSPEHERTTKFRDYADHLIPPHVDDKETVLLLAGDICEGWRAHTRYFGFFDRLSARFRNIVWIAGNHEYYGGKFSWQHHGRITGAMAEKWTNVHFVNSSALYFEDTVVLATTLWTDMDHGNPLATLAASDKMNDYKHITYADVGRDIYRTLRVNDTIAAHVEEWKWLSTEIQEQRTRNPDRKLIVVTHHAPSMQSIPQRYVDRNDILNHAYATHLPLETMEHLPDFWIHGHLHDSVDYELGPIRVLSNPFGYIGDHINKQYDLFAGFDTE